MPAGCGARDCRSPFDNDCDGRPDDTLDAACRCIPGSTQACEAPPQGDVGVCQSGTVECVLSTSGSLSDWGACVGARAAQARDCSSALDNDCNGHADDTECDCLPGATRACGAAAGSFGCSPGTETCVSDAGGGADWGPCSFAAEPDGTPCNDENPRTVGDACVAGACESLRDDLLVAGESFSCAVTPGGGLSCWGDLTPGLTGSDTLLPVAIAETGFTGVSAGGGTACAIRRDGTVACLLDNQFGERGNGAPSTVTDFNAMTDVELSGVVQLSTGFRNTAALDSAGLVWVWGDGLLPELFGPVAPSTVESPVLSSPTVPRPHRVRTLGNVAFVSVGTFHACALRLDGSVACWGDSIFGQLGVPGVESSAAPLDVSGLSGVTQLASGFGSCAIEAGGGVRCWGISCPGGVFDAFCAEPIGVAGVSDAIQVVTGGSTCVLERSGQVVCWGANAEGQLGDGTTVDRNAPQPVAGLTDAVLLARGGRGSHHCALRRSGQVVCWGYNGQGQLGDGTTTGRLTPVPVAGLLLSGPAPASPVGSNDPG